MANGYDPGDYLGKFLAQLPQIYSARQNAQLQRERFEYMKDEGIKDDVYRSQVLTANQERNQLARDQFKQRKNENIQDETYRKAVLESQTKTQEFNDFNQAYKALGDAGNKEGQEMLLKSKFKDNQQMVDTINENRDIKESMKQQVYSLDALPPEQRLIQARKLLSSPYLTEDLYNNLTTITKGGKDELQFTLQELRGTEFYPEYAKLETILNNPTPYVPFGEDATQFINTISAQMLAIKQQARKADEATYGEYPTYDNVEDIDDREIDSLIAGFEIGSPLAPFTERYPFSPSDNLNITDSESSEIQTAGKSMTTTPTSTQDTTATTTTPITPPTKKTETEKDSQSISAYTGTDANQKSEVDFFFELLKNGEISRKRFMEGIKKANVNPQSINLKMVYEQKGKPEKKQLSKTQQRSIKVLLSRINTISQRNFKKPGDKENKINKIKEDILAIDPNYKFQN